MSEAMTFNDDVVQRITLAPDAGLVKSLGVNHTLESALADLVDNSIDAGATRVAIRLLTHQERLTQVEVVDNGRGMDDKAVDAAMTIGHRREYDETDLGHFGMGLKAASFGHSDVLTLWSTNSGAASVGRRIRRADFSKNFTCEVLSSEAGDRKAKLRREVVGSHQGTTVVWTMVHNAYRGNSVDEARQWLSSRKEALRIHLGVTFHRLLESGRLYLDVLVDDVYAALDSPGVPVLPIDPFGYAVSGHPSYPKVLVASAGQDQVSLTCHVWPAKSKITGFRIGANSGEALQGFYIYRNDRLLQVGGWSATATPGKARQLARVVLEDNGMIGPFLTMNPEKSGLRFKPVFHEAISRAIAEDGTTFHGYLQDAESAYTVANRRQRRRHPVIKPGKGFTPSVRKRIGDELPFIDWPSLDIKWQRMADGEFFDIDLEGKTLWLNNRYRQLFAPYRGSLNDAPFLKTLMFLLTHHLFEGQQLGARDKDEIAVFKSILNAAVLAEARSQLEQAQQ